MSQNFSQTSIQSAIGYNFKDGSLLSAAFTHLSFSDTDNNEALAFLGSRLLDFVISDYICSRYPYSVEKQLSRRLDDFKKALEYPSFISSKGLAKYIRLSEKSEALRNERALHGEIFLALAAAIYKDGGMPSLKAFILPLLRAADGESHYQPRSDEARSSSAVVAEVGQEAKKSVKPEIKKALTVSEPEKEDNKSLKASGKAATVKEAKKDSKKDVKADKTERTTEEKAEEKVSKKGVGILKAILPTKGRKKDATLEAKGSEREEGSLPADKKAESDSAKEGQKRSFIRDALAPVSLPESMRNPRPKKPYKSAGDTLSTKGDAFGTEASASEKSEKHSGIGFGSKNTDTGYDESENYKSLLQEYVQKNIRSANVLLKYNTVRENGVFVTEITLDGKTLGKADGSVKKASEKSAARAAYETLTNTKSSLYSWFSAISEQGLAPEKAPENYVSRLNEYFQKKSRSSAAPLTYEARPSKEKKSFSVAIMQNGEELSLGTGHTVKDAKQNAAKIACEKLKI